MWERGQPALEGAAAAPVPNQSAAGNLNADRLAALESTLARIEKGMKAAQAASPEKRLYTVNEVAELVKLSEWTVRKACNAGRIKAEKGANGQWRIPRMNSSRSRTRACPSNSSPPRLSVRSASAGQRRPTCQQCLLPICYLLVLPSMKKDSRPIAVSPFLVKSTEGGT